MYIIHILPMELEISHMYSCPKYLGLYPRNSSEMANSPTSEQENPNFLGLDSKSAHCREINQNFL